MLCLLFKRSNLQDSASLVLVQANTRNLWHKHPVWVSLICFILDQQGTLWVLTAGTDEPGDASRKTLLFQKLGTKILASVEDPVTPGKVPQVSPGRAKRPQAGLLRGAPVLKRGREERSRQVADKTALQTPSTGCFGFPAFSTNPHSRSLLQTLYRQHHNQIPWGLKTFASSIHT